MRALIGIFLLIMSGTLWGQEITDPLQFLEQVHDFGEIDEAGGPVSEEFLFVNRADRPIKIISVKASCGCTTPGWTRDPVAPGETGVVRAEYDPRGRPGYFNKSLTVTTDSDGQPIILQIKGQVVSSKGGYPGELRVERGAWRLRESAFNMGIVYHHPEPSVKSFRYYNESEKVIHVTSVDAPSYIRVQTASSVDPNSIGKIELTYFGDQRAEYGFQSDNITFHTDDPGMPLKSFSVYATLEDDFSKLTDVEWDKSPTIVLGDSKFDFGRLKQGGSYTREVSFTNTGKSRLEIRSVQGNCTCIEATAHPQTLSPGESGIIRITFNPGERLNTQQKSVMVYSNDPKAPVKRILFNGYVSE